MAIHFNDIIELDSNITPTQDYHVATKAYVDSHSGGSGGSYTLPTAASDTLGGIKIGDGLSVDASTGVATVTGRFLSSGVATDVTSSSSVISTGYFTYNDNLYYTSSTFARSQLDTRIQTGLVSSVTVMSQISSKLTYKTGTSNPSYETDGTVYYASTASVSYLRVGSAWHVINVDPVFIDKSSAPTITSGTATLVLDRSKVIYPVTTSTDVTLAFDANNNNSVTSLRSTWGSSQEATFEVIITVSGASGDSIDVDWPENVVWLGDATTNGTPLTTLANGRTYYFVFRSQGGPPANWSASGANESIRWVGNFQGSVSNPES